MAVESEEDALARCDVTATTWWSSRPAPRRYWINSSSSKGSVLETLLGSRAAASTPAAGWERGTVSGRQLATSSG